MPLLTNKWFIPVLAMIIALGVSMARVYTYLDGVLNSYANSFYVDNEDHYIYWTFHSKELQQMVEAAKNKDTEFKKREDELAAWEARLKSESDELNKLKADLEKFRTGLTNIIVESKSDEMKNLKSLAATYAAMSPDAVVGIFGEMDDNTVVKILALMKADIVGPIFETMSHASNQEGQQRARIARISEKLRLYKQSQAAN